jgi:putative flippase GtrA
MTTPEFAGPLVARVAREYGKKVRRFVIVSLFNVAFGQSLLVLAHTAFGWSFVASNIFAIAVSAGPAYVLARYWVWEKTSKNHLVKEVAPFWGLAFLGLVVSTFAAGVAGGYTDAQIVLNLVNLVAFGIIWVFKFFILDRFMFGAPRTPLTATDAASPIVSGGRHE